jgi:translation initiation factor 3 subunit C
MSSKFFGKYSGGDSDDDDDDDETSEESESESEEDSDESGSDESDDSDEDSDEDSDDSDDVHQESAPKQSRFLKSATRADDDDDQKSGQKVVSKDTKRFQELEKIYTSVKQNMKIGDIKSVQDDIEQLMKKFMMLEKKAAGESVPDIFLKAAVHTERWLKDREEKEKRRKEASFEEDEEDEDEDKPKKKGAKEEVSKKDKKGDKAKALTYLKQNIRKITGKDDFKDRIKVIEKMLDKEEAGGDDDDDDDKDDEDNDDEFGMAKKDKERAEEEDKEWKPELIDKKLAEVLALRGKRGTDRSEQIEQLKRILAHTAPPMLDKRIPLIVHLIAAWFDNASAVSTHMPVNSWRNAYDNIVKLLNVMSENPTYILKEQEDELNEAYNPKGLTDTIMVPIDGNVMSFAEHLDDEFVKALQFTDPHTQAYVDRLSDELYVMDCLERVFHFYKSREMPKHAARIAARILDHLYYRRQEAHVKMLAKQRIQTDQRRRKTKKADEEEEKRILAAAEAAMEAEAGPEGAAEEEEEGQAGDDKKKKTQLWWSLTGNLAETMTRFMGNILKHGDEKAKARALLCKVYHLALHDQYTQARDIVLMSHIHEIVASANPNFQILFNRALAQLGMAAFRLGQFKDVHVCLNELCATQRVKELLAQGIPNPKYQQDRKPEEERQNKMKLCPFHMHINLDVLDAVSLVSAMLLEVPMMAANPYDSKRKVQSKAFNKLLHHYESQVFLGPPENTRDHIYAASKALLHGDWETCYKLIAELGVWELVPTGVQIKEMLQQRIKEEGLRAYLLQYAQFYETVSLKSMGDKFELEERIVHAVVSKMMFNEEISGSWDQPAGCVRIHRTNPTKLQYLCLIMSEKAQTLVENNEKILDARGGGFGSAYKMGQEVKPTRPTETLWGNFNRWSGVNAPGGMMRRGQNHRGGNTAFTQIGRGGNKPQRGGYVYGGGGGYAYACGHVCGSGGPRSQFEPLHSSR